MMLSRAKKSLGQNFLTDKNIVRKIIDTANIKPTDHVLEIGPGRGALTDSIIERCEKFTAIEADDKLFESLAKKYDGNPKVTLIHGDALKVDFSELALKKDSKLRLISNLPYNISGPMLARLVDFRDTFSHATLMLQKEVADRVSATTESRKDYGVLSVIIQNYADAFMEFTVPPTAFSPKPKVQSAIITLSFLDSPRFEVKDYTFFKKTVKAAFSQRRKTLLNSLKTMDMEQPLIEKALAEASIDPKRRAETLEISEFSALTASLLRQAHS